MKAFPFWLLAVVITLASAVYQRVTGPTYPVRGHAALGGDGFRYELPRSAETSADCTISLAAPEPAAGYIEYRGLKTRDAWERRGLVRRGAELVGSLPRQPAAGKLEYRVVIEAGGAPVPLDGGKPIVLRFKDPVPVWLLIPHVIIMFGGMLAATAAGLAALGRRRNPRRYAFWAAGLLFAGGFILGPLVQKAAFGIYWSGFPLGPDLTDTKTLVSFLFWIAALVAGMKGRPSRGLVLAASIVTLVIFLIPHSVLGS